MLKDILTIIIFVLFILTVIAVLTGCSGTGFDKRATLMPDRVGVSVGQERFKGEDAARRGVTFNAMWDLK